MTLLGYPNFAVNRWMQLETHYFPIQIRGVKQTILTAATAQLSTNSFHNNCLLISTLKYAPERH